VTLIYFFYYSNSYQFIKKMNCNLDIVYAYLDQRTTKYVFHVYTMDTCSILSCNNVIV